MFNMDVRLNQRWSTALEVPVQGQSLVETGQSLVQSLVQKKGNFGGTTGKEVVVFFNQTFRISYWHLVEQIETLKGGIGAIRKKQAVFHLLCNHFTAQSLMS